jgi:hypothetical protein
LPLRLPSRFALTLLSAALLSACNENGDSGITVDVTPPTITISNASLINGVVLAAPSSGTPVSFTIAAAGRIRAADNAGAVTLSVLDVVGLEKTQVILAADGTLSANNVLPSTPVGRGYVTLRARDASGNQADSRVYFDISPSTDVAAISAAPGERMVRKLTVMDSVRSAVLELPVGSVGLSGSAVLAGHEVTVTLDVTA